MPNTSEHLLERYAHDLDDCSRAIFDRYSQRILNLANRKLPSRIRTKVDPNDLLQETIAAAFTAIEMGIIQCNKKGELWNYIYGILCRKIASTFEKFSTAKRKLSIEEQLPTNLDGRQQFSASASSLLERLQSEKPLVQTVVHMCLEGYTQKEIAVSIGRSTRTVRRILDSYRSKLIQLGQVPNSIRFNAQSTDSPAVNFHGFTLLRMLGAGSFSKVYLARANESQEYYAFKAVRKQWLQNQTVRLAFINEFEKLRQIEDPHVVNTFGWGELPNGGLFLVLEYVDGIALSQHMNEASKIQRVKWIEEIGQTVTRLHRKGIAHRDLSLRNILITQDNSIKLIDFAFSKFIGNFTCAKNEDLAFLDRMRQEMRVKSQGKFANNSKSNELICTE